MACDRSCASAFKTVKIGELSTSNECYEKYDQSLYVVQGSTTSQEDIAQLQSEEITDQK